jgi:hypothetical protein
MTMTETIMQTVAVLVREQGKETFSREEIREQAGIDREQWNLSYSPTFQGMRADQPGGAPALSEKFRGVFRQVAHGQHTLTEYGKELLKEFQS